MFNWFTGIDSKAVKIGDIRSTRESPFLETLTVSCVIDIKDGYVLYAYCDLVNGEWVPRPASIGRHSELTSTYKSTFHYVLESGNQGEDI